MSDLRKLINIVESPEEIRAKIEDKLKVVDTESDLSDILKYTQRYVIKGDVDIFVTLRQYRETVSRVILKSLANAGLEQEEVQKFLDKLSDDGILDVKELMTPGKLHRYEDLIDSKFRPIFDKIKLELFDQISGKIGELGDVGKGEYMLDIISPLIKRRGAPGDLSINGTNVELKAGQNGRLGPAGSMSLAGRFEKEFMPMIVELMPEKSAEELVATNFNLKLNMSYFSEFFETGAKVKKALTLLLSMHYPNTDVKKIVSAVVSSSGEIDGQKLKEEMLAASFSAYKAAKEFDGIIIMDTGVTCFMYLHEPSDFVTAASSFIVTFPSWTDQQSNCIKITLSKSALSSKSGASSNAKRTTSIVDIDKETEAAAKSIVKGNVSIRPPGTEAKSKSRKVSPPRETR